MGYSGQNPREINGHEFNEIDRQMAYQMISAAESDRPISASGILRLAHLEAHGSNVQAAYFLGRIGACAGAELDIDLPRGESGLVSKHDFDAAVGTLWKWQSLAQS